MQTEQEAAAASGAVVCMVRRRRRHPATSPWQVGLARLLWLEPLWIALLAPALLFPGRFWVAAWQPGLVLLLFAFWPLRLLCRRAGAVPRLLLLPAAGLVAAVAAALAASPFPAASWEAAGYLLLGVTLAPALVQWPPVQRQPGHIAWLLLALGAGLAITGPLLLGAMPTKFGLGALIPGAGGLSGALGESVNPNVLGGALVIPTLLAAALAIGPRTAQQPWRLVWALLAAAFLAVLLLTQCRGAWLGMAAGFGLLLSVRWPRLAWVIAPAAVAAAVLLVSGMGAALVFDAMTGTAAGRGLGARPALWEFAAAVARENPQHGAGLGLFAAVQPATLVGAGSRAPHAHNLLLQVTMDLGLPGLLAYGAVLSGVGTMLLRLLRTRPTYRRRLHWTMALGTAAAVTGVLVHGLVDAALWGNKVAFLPWLLFALAASLYQYTKDFA
jgi:putative inorganic carbon (HCO3(-)) transporter